ncbi:GTPase IMAP family member 4-like [Littorina saxatilis]|uniref:AIG1-type G domain-containing protein n=1 Tax=Littorina saxatilis TaxID=31220 RepID=A0AAN9BIH4_9CAEN
MACSKEASSSVVRLMLVGKTGSGKSSSANMILGRKALQTSDDFSSDTSECTKKDAYIDITKVEVMDTPGLFDTSKSHDEVGLVIVRCVIELHPGPDAVFVVFKLGDRYTEEDFGAYRRLKRLFGVKVTKHIIVLFTGGDKLLKGKKTSVEQFLHKAPKNLVTVLEECERRYVVLNNELSFTDGKDQVKELLGKVQELRERNKNMPYVCDNYSRIGKTLEDVETLKQEIGVKMREVEAQEAKAMKYVQERDEEYRAKLDELNLTREEYEKQTKALEQKLEDDYKERMDEWEKDKAAEEKAMREKRDEQEKELKKQMDEHDRKLQEKEKEINNKMEEQQAQHDKNMKEEQEAHRKRLEERDASFEKQQKTLEQLKDKDQQHEKTMAFLNTASQLFLEGTRAACSSFANRWQQPKISITNVLPDSANRQTPPTDKIPSNDEAGSSVD